MFFIAYDFKGQVHVFAVRVKIVIFLSPDVTFLGHTHMLFSSPEPKAHG